MKKIHKILDYILLGTGIFFVLYYLINIPISGIFTFHIIFLMGGALLILYSVIEFYRKQNIFLLLPKTIRNIILSILSVGILCFISMESIIISYGFQENYEESDVVIVLGAGLMEDRISTTLSYRLDKAIDYHEKYPKVPIIVSGGQGRDELRSEAEAMKEYLIAQGVEESLILMEDQAENTYENFQYSYELIKEQNINAQKITVITNRFHMFRSVYIGNKFTYEINALAAKDYLPLSLQTYVREFFAVIKAFIWYH